MIYLIISLSIFPFVNSEIYTATIEGKDKAPGSIKANDTVTITTTSLLPVTVDFNDTGFFRPMKCDSSIPVTCTYSEDVKNVSIQHDSVVREQGSLDTKYLSAYLDEIPPSITKVTFENAGWGVSAVYSIKDEANEEAPKKCSGIKSVQIILDGKPSTSVSHPPGVCLVNSTVTGTVPNIKGNINSSAIIVEDYAGLKTTKSYSGPPFFVESIPPKIGSKVLVYRAGTDQEVKNLPPNASVTVDLVITVTEEAMNNDIWVDLSAVNGSKEFKGSHCNPDSNQTFLCKYSNTPIKLEKSNSKVTFFVRDVAGNVANLSTTLPITVTPPTMTSRIFAMKPGGLENITMIGGPNASRLLPADLYFEIKYNSAFPVNRLVADIAEIGAETASLGGEDGNVTSNATEPTVDSGDEDSSSGNTTLDKLAQFKTYSSSSSFEPVIVESSACEEIDEKMFLCIVEGVGLRAAKAGPRVNVTVYDEAGGKANMMLTPSFAVVMSAGSVNSITPPPERCQGDTCYMNPGNNPVIAQISAQSTYNESLVSINGAKGACIGTWVCNATVRGGTSLSLKGEDDLGNPISGTSTSRIVLDSSPPEFESEIMQEPECPTSSESLTIIVNASEKGSPMLVIKADTSKISEMNETESACSQMEDGGKYNCVLSIGGLLNKQINTNLEVILEDLAGNQVKQSIPVSICVMSDEVPDFIRSFLPRGTMPRIDRKVASKSGFNLKVPIGLEMTLADDQTYILERSQVSCSETPGAREAYLINDESMTPIMMISLHYVQEWDDIGDRLDVNCSQEFMIRHGNVRYNNPEVEPIKANLTMFNQPLGTLNASLDKKVRDIKAQLRALDQKIDKYNGYDRYLGSICDTAEKLGAINNIIQGLQPIIYGISLILYNIPYTKGAGKAIWTAYSKVASSFKGSVEKYLWPQGWWPSGANDVGFVVKYTCTIYNCKIYDMNTWVDIGMSVANHYLVDQPNQPTNPSQDSNTVGGVTVRGDESGLVATVRAADGTIYDVTGVTPTASTSPAGSVQRVQGADNIQITSNNGQSYTIPRSNEIGFTPKNPISHTNLEDANIRLRDSVDAFMGSDSSWIFNPYKSKHYDRLCIPAIIFNSQKEKQLLCKKLGCIDEMSKIGGPLEACEFEYQMTYCMYVESARYKLDEGFNFGDFINGIKDAFMSNIIGIAAVVTYMFVPPFKCHDYQRAGGDNRRGRVAIDDYFNVGSNLACGVMGMLLSLQELTSVKENLYNAAYTSMSPTDISSLGAEFCSGVNYAN